MVLVGLHLLAAAIADAGIPSGRQISAPVLAQSTGAVQSVRVSQTVGHVALPGTFSNVSEPRRNIFGRFTVVNLLQETEIFMPADLGQRHNVDLS